MAPWPHNPANSDDSAGLTDLLSPDELSDLTLLLATALQSIRTSIEDGFDKVVMPQGKTKTANPLGSKEEVEKLSRLEDESSAEKSTPVADHKDSSTSTDGKQPDSPTHIQEAVADKTLEELRKAALAYFFKWQESVISRTGEAINHHEKPHDKKHAGATTLEMPAKDLPPSKAAQDSGTALTQATDKTATEPDQALAAHYPPIHTPLSKITKGNKLLILNSVLLLLLSLEQYPSHSRLLLLHLTSSLHLSLSDLVQQETKVAQSLVKGAKHLSGDAEKDRRGEEGQSARRWKTGIAAVAGAAVIGITGGLAAPLVAGAIGSVLGGIGLGATAAAGLLGTLAESGIIVGALFGAYGGNMTSKMVDKYAAEVSDFAFLPLRAKRTKFHTAEDADPDDRRLRVTIGISGWLTSRESVVNRWRLIGHATEPYALRFELESLMKLGTSLESTVKSALWSAVKTEIIKRTVFAAILDVLGPIAILKISKMVDNPFSVAKSRAEKAGLVLADALINRVQGQRPVTLIGYSLGARVIYSCLRSLADRKAFGLVESAVLLGSPVPSDTATWRMLKAVVTGRLVNVYSENDFILGFLYRTSSIQYGIAGMQPVNVVGVQNVDASAIISGHLRWPVLMGRSLKSVGWDDLDMEEVQKEEEILRLMDDEERKREEQGEKEAQPEKMGEKEGATAA